MRERFSDAVEKYRHCGKSMGTRYGDPYGLFWLMHPRTRRRLKVIVSDGLGWDHVSVSHSARVPTWDEMCWVKQLFFRPDECVVQFHPKQSDYVNMHSNCLHMWRMQEGEFPMPPRECV
jgi:hypothetical protein